MPTNDTTSTIGLFSKVGPKSLGLRIQIKDFQHNISKSHFYAAVFGYPFTTMLSAESLFVFRFRELSSEVQRGHRLRYLQTASILRQLFGDGDSLIHQANKVQRLRIRFKVNNMPLLEDLPVRPAIWFTAQGLDPTIFKIPAGTKELKIDDFMSLPLLATPEATVTTRDLIKFLANKAGGVHYTDERTPHELKLEEAYERIKALGPNSFILSLQTVASIALEGLRPLWKSIVHIPTDLPLLAHYMAAELPATGPRIHFEGKGQFMETSMSETHLEGFTFCSILRILPQAEAGKRVLYEIGHTEHSKFLATLSFDGKDCGMSIRINGSEDLNAMFKDFNRSPYFGNFIYLVTRVDIGESGSRLEVSINLEHRVSAETRTFPENRTINRQTIASALDGSCSASVEYQELILGKLPFNDRQLREVHRYLILKWGDN